MISNLDKKFVISIIITVILALSGVFVTFFIHTNAKKQVFTSTSKLADVESTNKTSEVKDKDLKTIIYESQKLVVNIEIQTYAGKGIGSGFLYNDKGDIITNAHVVDGASSVTIKMADTTIYKGTVIGRSNSTDVALIRVPELTGKSPMKITKGKKVDIGDEVIALGSPLGLQNTATTGIISGLNRDFEIENFKYKGVYQISAPISPGNSGGPLLDKKTGEVLGINSAKLGEETIGFSIPIDQVLSLVNNWSANPSISESNSTSTNSNESSGKIFAEDAEYMVSYFYHSVDSKDYVAAYSYLGSDWQKKMTYESFRKGYLDTLSVEIENMTDREIDDKAIEVVAVIKATERVNGENKLSKYKVTYTVGYENNKLKILHGEAKKI